MHHPGTNAELARLRHTEALRAARHAHELRNDVDVLALYTLRERVVSRLASRLAPELYVTLPWPTAARRAGEAQA